MLKLRSGAKLMVEVEQTDRGFKVSIVKRVGSHVKVNSTKHVASEAAMWLTIIRWGEKRLAQLGLEATR